MTACVMDPDRDATVVALTRAGFSARQIAVQLKLTPRSVVRARRRTGCSRPAAIPLTESEKATALRLLEDGCSYSEAARTIGRAADSLQKAFPGYGWTVTQAAQHAAVCSQLARKVLR